MKWRVSWFPIVNGLLLTGVALATLYPFVYMAAVSLSSPEHVIRNEVFLWPKGWTLDTYRYVLEDERIWTGYKNTIIYTVIGTTLSLICTAMGAYSLSKRNLVFGKPIMMMIVFTMLFSGGMIPTFLVVRELGLMNTMWAMIIPGLFSTWNLIIMRTFFQGIPAELEESGKMDGLTDLGVFVRIVIPLSKSIFATIGLFYAVGIWNNFYHALLYLRQESLFPLQVVVRNMVLAGQYLDGNIVAGGDSEMMMEESLKYATIIISTLPILMSYPFIQKYFVKGVLIGSLKG
ncbi:carbohydrate ABC transporter permease [Paenibacillus senegalensis]|uniref:carbohydrate ABC transporter permease n=1 Tax=Paenibacillus senegalensis TaxID=1465766 RepID=UPI0002889DAC|nr:carbohydrate ABC transporter permease [Paenibacillus senegalensis]